MYAYRSIPAPLGVSQCENIPRVFLPAVSQIWSLTVFLSIFTVRNRKSTPIVEMYDSVKASSYGQSTTRSENACVCVRMCVCVCVCVCERERDDDDDNGNKDNNKDDSNHSTIKSFSCGVIGHVSNRTLPLSIERFLLTANRSNKHDFPTPLSPISTSLNR